MSKTILLNQNWIFSKEGHDEPVTLPHTWNAIDGQDGGNDYYRGTCCYTTVLPDIVLPENGRAVLQFDAVAMTAEVYLNEQKLAEHKGGYSAFCVDITDALRNGSNLLRVNVDNSDNDTVYPQKADFTFYGGIYRDVTLHVVPAAHFALAENGAEAFDGTVRGSVQCQSQGRTVSAGSRLCTARFCLSRRRGRTDGGQSYGSEGFQGTGAVAPGGSSFRSRVFSWKKGWWHAEAGR